jgi:hypothetical protein
VGAYASLGEHVVKGDCGELQLSPLELHDYAAAHGNVSSLLYLGDTYASGNANVKKDVVKARYYFEQVLASKDASNDQKNNAREAIAELEEKGK